MKRVKKFCPILKENCIEDRCMFWQINSILTLGCSGCKPLVVRWCGLVKDPK